MIDIRTNLLPHQERAVEKLRHLKVGALYMEMGTGKTLTALKLAEMRMSKGKINHVIWLCPCSVKQNLALDISRHADVGKGDITICGIESVSESDRISLALYKIAQESRSMLVVDESNMVKNPRALRSQRITQIAEFCPYRIILNGTPISRTEADMFQQWYILDWRILGYKSYYSFAANHIEFDERFRGKIRRVLNVDYLTDKIAPYSVQIKKSDCLTLPDKDEETCFFWMTDEQEQHYEDMLDMFLCEENLHEDDMTSVWIYKTFTVAQQVASGRRITNEKAKDTITHESFFQNPADNPRIKELLRIIKGIGDEKTVIWCKFSHEVEDVTAALTTAGYSCVEFTGSVPQKQRQQNIKAFSEDVQFFVANKQCAGYGLNLQFCRNAIYYNNDWDWATRAQSEDRLHRIGQEEQVRIWNIAASGTIDIRILECLTKKTNMVERFRNDVKGKNWDAWFKGKEIDGLTDGESIHK